MPAEQGGRRRDAGEHGGRTPERRAHYGGRRGDKTRAAMGESTGAIGRCRAAVGETRGEMDVDQSRRWGRSSAALATAGGRASGIELEELESTDLPLINRWLDLIYSLYYYTVVWCDGVVASLNQLICEVSWISITSIYLFPSKQSP